MKVRIEFEEDDACSSFSVVEFSREDATTVEMAAIAVESFMDALSYYEPQSLIAEIVSRYFGSGSEKTLDDALAKVDLKIVD